MTHRKTLIALVCAAATVAAATAGAQETAPRTTLSGFVDAAYVVDSGGKNGEFGADQAEIDIEHRAGARTLLRADLEWVKDGEEHVARVEQAFMTWTPPCGWAFTLGKFNAPIGFELLDPHEMYQYSHALVFDHGLPTNLTGARVDKVLGGGFDLTAHVSNGWDRQTADANPTWGGRLGYAAGGFAGGASAISGKEIEPVGGEAFTRTVLDADLSYATGRWLFGGELNRGTVDLPAGAEASWLGGLAMTHVELNAWAGLTVRYDRFDDEDGRVFGLVGGEPQVRQAVAIAPTFVLDEGFGALVELRLDFSDRDAFVDADGEATDTTTTLAFEMTYVW